MTTESFGCGSEIYSGMYQFGIAQDYALISVLCGCLGAAYVSLIYVKPCTKRTAAGEYDNSSCMPTPTNTRFVWTGTIFVAAFFTALTVLQLEGFENREALSDESTKSLLILMALCRFIGVLMMTVAYGFPNSDKAVAAFAIIVHSVSFIGTAVLFSLEQPLNRVVFNAVSLLAAAELYVARIYNRSPRCPKIRNCFHYTLVPICILGHVALFFMMIRGPCPTETPAT